MSLDQMPACERAQRYRELAREQGELARASGIPEVRMAHEELAAMWTRLASQAEWQVTSAPGAEVDVSRGSTTE